jgi:hypothetical protein
VIRVECITISSQYFDTLLARYCCVKKIRPGTKPRLGSVVERLLGTSEMKQAGGNRKGPPDHAPPPLPLLYGGLADGASRGQPQASKGQPQGPTRPHSATLAPTLHGLRFPGSCCVVEISISQCMAVLFQAASSLNGLDRKGRS